MSTRANAKIRKIHRHCSEGTDLLSWVPIKENQEFSVNDIESGALTPCQERIPTVKTIPNFMFSVSDGIEYSTPQLGGFKIRPVEDEPILVTSTGRLFTNN